MRAADAIEKITRSHPEWLQPYTTKLIGKWSQVEQQEVRWHVALMLPRVKLSAHQRQVAIKNLKSWLQPGTKSAVVRVFSLQALFDLKADDFGELVAEILDDPTTPPSLRSRATKLWRLSQSS